MALGIFERADLLHVVAGYESGHSMTFECSRVGFGWKRMYTSQPHSQPGKKTVYLVMAQIPGISLSWPQYSLLTYYHLESITLPPHGPS